MASSDRRVAVVASDAPSAIGSQYGVLSGFDRGKASSMAAPRTCAHFDNGFDLLGIVEEKMAGVLLLDRFCSFGQFIFIAYQPLA
jgi:hypothetical protein